jgi:nicotinamide-nucleotide amidase
MALRAGIVVTGTEVLDGRVTDRNGPWLSDQLRRLGAEVAHISAVGDRPEDMRHLLEFLAADGVQLICTSGGLGPTADDLTAQVVADFQRRPLALDPALEERIWAILAPLRERWPDLDQDAVRDSNRKQALVPAGAAVLPPVGTAPGLIVPPPEGSGGPTVIVLPGPPRELQPMWRAAEGTPAFAAALAGAVPYRRGMLRLFGIPESELAATLRDAEAGGLDLGSLEITTCMRRGELEMVSRYEPAEEQTYDALAAFMHARHGPTLFSDDGTSIDDQVAGLLLGTSGPEPRRPRTIATAESCTGGLLAARLTERPGSSAYVAGGTVTYSNAAKTALIGVPAELIAAHGAVSPEVAVALAEGAIERFGTDLGVGITGVAGPDGGTPEKPVGYVCHCVAKRGGRRLARTVNFPGDRVTVRDRSTTVAMHLVRRLLLGQADTGADGGAEPSRT